MPCIVMIIASLLQVPLCYLFVYGLDMGIVGLGFASSVKDGVLMLAVTIYGCYSS